MVSTIEICDHHGTVFVHLRLFYGFKFILTLYSNTRLYVRYVLKNSTLY